MRFLILVRHNSSFNPPETIGNETTNWVDTAEAKNARIVGDRVCSPNDAKLVSMIDGKISAHDGPLSDEEYQIAGFDVLEVEDMEKAIEIVAAHPMAKYGLIEIRQFWKE